MAQFSYEDFLKKEATKPQGNFEKGEISFLSNYLQNDGDSVLVRFPYATPNDFTFYSLHRVNVEGKYKNILCLRNDTDPVGACPLCAKGDNAKDRILIKCIAYIQGDRGIEIKPCVWERPAKFARNIAECITSFPNSVYKVSRMGAKGSKDTNYTIMPTSPQIYNEQAYPIDFSKFGNFKFNNFMFLDRTFEELAQFVQTGRMPQRVKVQEGVQGQAQGYAQPQTSAQPQYATPTPQLVNGQQNVGNFAQAEANPFPTNNAPQQFNWQQPAQQPVAPQGQQQENKDGEQQQAQRPVRTYF